MPATYPKVSASTRYKLSRFNTFTLSDFGSSVSLSTLRPCRYLHTRKTRYMVGLASPSTVGLSPTRYVQLSWRTGYFYQPSTLLPSLESIRRFHERSAVRYAQVSRRRPIPESNRDISDYQVNERAPTDEDITHVLCSLSWQINQNPDRQTHLQRYLQRWGCWFKSGLTEIDAFMTSVQLTLPSLGMALDKQDISTILLTHVN